MSVLSPLLIVSVDNPDIAGINSLAEAIGYPEAHIISGSFAEGAAALDARMTPPEYMIVDIGGHSRDILDALDELAVHCDARTRVVVIGTVNDISFYRELRTRGVVEYIAQPVNPTELRNVLMQAPAQPVAAPSRSLNGTVISFMSAASGDGASTVAVNTAFCLAEEFGHPTVLIDMDYQFGLIAKSLDLTAPFGIREIFDHPERGVDELLVDKMLVKYGRNLSIISAPNELRQLPAIKPEVIRELITVLRKKFRFIIIDIPHVWTQWSSAAISYSDHVTMVGQLWLRSLTHASRIFTAWQTLAIAETAITLVINRSGAKFKEAITSQDFERICRHKVDAHINNNVKAIVNAETHGKTLFEAGQDIILQQQIRELAHALATRHGATGATGAAPHIQAEPDKKSLLGFLGIK